MKEGKNQHFKHQGNLIGNEKRKDFDFYETPIIATKALLERENFKGNIWEPSSGYGAISQVLEEKGYDVHSSDIQDSDKIYGKKGNDFLKSDWKPCSKIDNIITNPPYNLGKEFVKKSLETADSKVVMILRTLFLVTIKRSALFTEYPFSKIYIFSNRIDMRYGKYGTTGGMMDYAWFIWDKNHKGKPTMEWILINNKSKI